MCLHTSRKYNDRDDTAYHTDDNDNDKELPHLAVNREASVSTTALMTPRRVADTPALRSTRNIP